MVFSEDQRFDGLRQPTGRALGRCKERNDMMKRLKVGMFEMSVYCQLKGEIATGYRGSSLRSERHVGGADLLNEFKRGDYSRETSWYGNSPYV
jgi:hypothetical protein